MKVIISHDVDHITVWEHKRDLIIPKFIVRSFIEFGLGYISPFELKSRFKSILEDRWQNLEELMQFDKENEIAATFFIGVANGLGLSYSLKDAEFWIKRIQQKGFDVGVHGISFDNYDSIKKEYATFKELSKLDNFGIRIHYIRLTSKTLDFLNRARYLFDSSLYKSKPCLKIGGLWEFPLHVMDSYIMCKDSKWQNQTFDKVRERTINEIDRAHKHSIKYFSILFHDRHFHNGFKLWKDWYLWLITYLKDNQIKFISYRDAIKELEAKCN